MKKQVSPAKPTAKRTTLRAGPSAPARKTAAVGRSHAAAKKGVVPKLPPGYTRNPNGKLLLPAEQKAPPGVVKATKLQQGLEAAREQISVVLHELVEAASAGYEIAEIELAVSFNAKGQFLGFGVGGDASIKFKVRPIPGGA